MTWTDARIAQLTRLWSQGVSAAGIAEALGDVSRSAVLGKLHRLRLLRSRKAASAPRRFDGQTRAAAPVRPGAAVLAPSAARSVGPITPPITPPVPPRSPWREAAFEPLAGTTPRPWLTREFGECAFPVGGDGDQLMSCCAPVKARSGYCPTHHAVAFRPVSPAGAPEARRWADAVERWVTQDRDSTFERSAA